MGARQFAVARRRCRLGGDDTRRSSVCCGSGAGARGARPRDHEPDGARLAGLEQGIAIVPALTTAERQQVLDLLGRQDREHLMRTT